MTYDPIPAAGPGAELFDQPTLFYLSNRPIIDEWYALRSNVAEALGEWYRTAVRDALVGPAAERGLEVAIARGPGSYHHLVLHPPDATILGTKPVIGIGLAWPSKSVNPSADSVFACVRCSRNQTGKNAAALFLATGGREVRAGLYGAKGNDSDTWPVWWWVRAEEQWWTKLDAYSDILIAEVLRLTDAAREPLEAASRVPIVGSAEESE